MPVVAPQVIVGGYPSAGVLALPNAIATIDLRQAASTTTWSTPEGLTVNATSVTFDGSKATFGGNSKVVVDFGQTLAQPVTVAFLVKTTGADGNKYLWDGIDGTNRLAAWRQASPDQVAVYGGSTVSLRHEHPHDDYVLWTAVYDGANSRVYRDGKLVMLLDAGSLSMAGITLGRRYNDTEGATADALYALVYDEALNDFEAALLTSELRSLTTKPVKISAPARTLTASNAASALTTPTYDGSGQATHPDVLKLDGYGPDSSTYVMAMTPYPNADSGKENPSILVSDDKETWSVPTGLTNPIEAAPATGFHSDASLVLDSDGVTLHLVYRHTDSSDTLYLTSTTDLVTWSARSSILTGTANELMSPSIEYDASAGLYVMHYVISGSAASPNTLMRRTSADLSTWSAARACFLPLISETLELWHVDVLKESSSEWHAIVDAADLNTSGEGGGLYLCTSPDGIDWVNQGPIMGMGGAGAWDADRLYRASGVRTVSGYDLWYGGVNASNQWRIGYTTATLG